MSTSGASPRGSSAPRGTDPEGGRARAARPRPGPRRWVAFAHRFETWLTLFALPFLVFRERFPISLQRFALLWIGLLWLARRLDGGRWTKRSALDIPALLFLSSLPGAWMAARIPEAATSRALSLIFSLALAYALLNFLRSPRRAWLAATWLLLAGLALVAVGLVSIDWLDKLSLLSGYLSGLPRLVGAVPHATLPAYGPEEGVGVHPNSVAALLVLFVPLAISAWRASRSAGGAGARVVEKGEDPLPSFAPPPWLRPLSLAALVTMLPMLVLTQSRGALAGLIVSLGLMALSGRPRAFRWASGGLVAALVLLVLQGMRLGGAGSAAALRALGVETLAGRVELWSEALTLLRASPWTGIGLNNFLVLHGSRPEYEGGFVYQGMPHAHNLYLQAALDYGLLGLLALLWLCAGLAWAALRAHRRLGATPLARLVEGLAFGLLAHALHGLVDSVSIGSKAGFVAWAFAGVLAGVGARAKRWSRGGPGPGGAATRTRVE